MIQSSFSDLEFPEYSMMEKVHEYGYEHLIPQEKVQLALELIGYNKKNPGFKTVRELFDASSHELRKVFSPEEITKLKTITEISSQYLKENMAEKKIELTSPKAVHDFLRLKISNLEKEKLVCFFLNRSNQLIDYKTLSEGTVEQVVLYPREIIKEALSLNASGLILAHNHPSGQCEPSGQDIRLTESIKNAATPLEIKVLDHMVIGKSDYFSFLEESLMEPRAAFQAHPVPPDLKPSGTTIQNVHHVHDLDLRGTNLYSLGSLKTVSGDIHIDSDCKVPKQSWSKIDIQGRVFVNGHDKTEKYINVQAKPNKAIEALEHQGIAH